MWPRPPRPRAVGLLTCRPCADQILTVLDEVLELAATLELVTAAGSAPRTGDGGRKRIKDEPVAPVPVRLVATALTDVRSSRGTWVPDAPTPAPQQVLDEDGQPIPVEQLAATVAAASKSLDVAIALFGRTSDQARAAATDLDVAQAWLRVASSARPPSAPRTVSATDNDPASVVGFIDRWTDRVRAGRRLSAGPCQAHWRIAGPARAGESWPIYEGCGQPAEYRRLIRVDAGARTTGLFTVCPAGHVVRPVLGLEQGDQPALHRDAAGHRPTRGLRHGLTIFSGIGLLRRHNEWICEQPWVPDYWRALRELRRDLGQAHGEQKPTPIGNCRTSTGDTDPETGHDIECGQPLYASGYSDTIECTRCGQTWDHRQWRFLGRALGVIA